MNKANGVDAAAAEVQSYVKAQLKGAKKRLQVLEVEAEKVLKDLVSRGRQSRKGLDELLGSPTVKGWGKRAETASNEVRRRLDLLQSRVVKAVGVASQTQLGEITKE